MTGVSAVQYFSVPIFEQIGISTSDTLKYQAINSVLALIAQGFCMAFIDKFGRRPTLITGMLVNCVMFLVAAILISKFGTGSGEGLPLFPSSLYLLLLERRGGKRSGHCAPFFCDLIY